VPGLPGRNGLLDLGSGELFYEESHTARVKDRMAPVRSEFSPKGSGLTGLLSSGINFCPWCGKELQFLE